MGSRMLNGCGGSFWPWALLLVVVLIAGCNRREDVPAEECGTENSACCADAVCSDGLVCEADICVAISSSIGRSCQRNGDCSGGFCIPLGDGRNVCTVGCPDGGGCLPGWTCSSSAGNELFCKCTPGAEVCDGRDNDCNGHVDENPAADNDCVTQLGSGHLCFGGSCTGASCASSADCLADEICSPVTRSCEPRGADAGGTCSSRYDCVFGMTCTDGTCVTVGSGATCATSENCSRGQRCNFSHTCVEGCDADQDCDPPQLCSPNNKMCAGCSSSNPCPNELVCVGTGPSAQCITPGCSTSAECQNRVPGSFCDTGSCSGCTQDSHCQVAPYGGGYVCVEGLCHVGCNVSQCQATCGQQGFSCNVNACQCEAFPDCIRDGCVGGEICVASGSCGGGTNTCGVSCANSSCASGWTCVDYTQAQCSSGSGLTQGKFCQQQCLADANCPGTQLCCPVPGGGKACSLVGACLPF